MKVTRVVYSREILVGTKQYENQRVGASVELQLDDGDRVDAAFGVARATVVDQLTGDLMSIKGIKDHNIVDREVRNRRLKKAVTQQYGLDLEELITS